ncbi:MAG: 7-cyano-7-deazaguanine synthase QueC [Francisellaceae bacterium]
MNQKKAVIIFSGGQDSTTCLALAKSQGYECYALSFDYGQHHRIELEAAKKIAAKMGVHHKILDIRTIGALGGSALTDDAIEIKTHEQNKLNNSIPSTYVPARNIIFLSIALGYAEIVGAEVIYIGVSQVDYSNYPDCRLNFIKAFEHAANEGTKAGVEDKGIKIITPLIELDKAGMVKIGHELGVDYRDTVTCYQANSEGRACGQCDACYLRKKGFEDAGIADETHYYDLEKA